MRNTAVDRCWRLIDYIRRVVRLDIDVQKQCQYIKIQKIFRAVDVRLLAKLTFVYDVLPQEFTNLT